MKSFIASGVLVLATGTSSLGVVVEGQASIVPRPAAGWVGSWNGSSAVPVSPYWFLSARHVGGSAGQVFFMRGLPYLAVEVREHPSLDLQLVRVATAMPGWHAIAAQPAVGAQVVLGGYGVTTANPLPGGAGWDWSGPHAETWGKNVIEATGSMLRIRFDAPGSAGAVAQESAFAVNDSGGGLFVTGWNGQLELAGTAVSVSAPGSSAYGVLCYSVGLHTAQGWIAGIIGATNPPTMTCNLFEFIGWWFAHDPAADFNGNGVIDVADIFAYLNAWFAYC